MQARGKQAKRKGRKKEVGPKRKGKKPTKKAKPIMPVELKRKEIFENHFTVTSKIEHMSTDALVLWAGYLRPGDIIRIQLSPSRPRPDFIFSEIGYVMGNKKVKLTHKAKGSTVKYPYPKGYRSHEKLPLEEQKVLNTMEELVSHLQSVHSGSYVSIEALKFKPEFKRKRKREK